MVRATRQIGDETTVFTRHYNSSLARQTGPPVAGFTLSLGVATLPTDALSAGQLLLAADNAELAAKRAGKNRVCAADPLVQG
jgi:PleD family two-component response regulator